MASNTTFYEPPLVTSKRIETVSETGEKIHVTTVRRGILGTESRAYSSFPALATALCNELPKKQLESSATLSGTVLNGGDYHQIGRAPG